MKQLGDENFKNRQSQTACVYCSTGIEMCYKRIEEKGNKTEMKTKREEWK